MWVGLPRGGVKDNKEETDALAWKAWPLQLEHACKRLLQLAS